MTHIASCKRRGSDILELVYIMEETTCCTTTVPTGLGIIQHSPTEVGKSGGHTPELVQSPLWPRPPSKALASPLPGYFLENKSMALAVGRSPTSLSDTAVNHEPPTIWRSGGSLSRRRNISVPELTGKLSENINKLPVQGNFIDSQATIPGRPPLRKAISEMIHHERSSSAPGTWRDCPFGDAMISCVEEPSVNSSPFSARTHWASVLPHKAGRPITPFNPTRPLSPIFSPREATTPTTAVPIYPTRPLSPIFSPLEVTTPTTAVPIYPISSRAAPDVPPKVPPKPSLTDGVSPLPIPTRKQSLTSKASRPWLRSTSSKASLKHGTEITTLATSPPTSDSSSPTRSPGARSSPGKSKPPTPIKDSKPSPVLSMPEGSVMERKRPIRRSLKKQKSTPAMFNHAEADFDIPIMPAGLRPMEALLVLGESEKAILRNQAAGQAEHFEVLEAKHVSSLSRELRALDERCEYLRKTYKSLRSGRHKLHARMISYLKSESLIFSRERLLKQQEALIELDQSIDDWIEKLERAENRRLRLRQKLLEHVAAAMALNMAHQSAQQLTHTTPPRSPIDVVSPRPLRLDRKEVESIKIYADNQVLNLFNDIEQAVSKMCEAC